MREKPWTLPMCEKLWTLPSLETALTGTLGAAAQVPGTSETQLLRRHEWQRRNPGLWLKTVRKSRYGALMAITVWFCCLAL
jgi:hypothetical protein